MRDRPVVVVMDGWHLREKSKVFLKFFFWFDTMWHEKCLLSFSRFMQNSRDQ